MKNMATYRVEALEKFLVRTTYFVMAADVSEAERLCRAGKVAYDRHSIEEGDDEWVETVSVEKHAVRADQEEALR